MEATLTTAAGNDYAAGHKLHGYSGRGLICLAMTGERLDHLELSPMMPSNSALAGPAFTRRDMSFAFALCPGGVLERLDDGTMARVPDSSDSASGTVF
jgi:hypothetical protein